MAIYAHRLQAVLLVCLIAAWPLVASAQAPAQPAPAERLAVSRTMPGDASDPIWLWFREQDKLLDDILLRLVRVENLVGDIHRLIDRMPDQPGTAAAPAPVPPPARVTPAVKPPPVAAPADDSDPAPGFFTEWAPQLAGSGLLLLLLFWWSRRRGATPKAATSAVPAKKAVPPVPATAPAAPAPAVKAPAAPAPVPDAVETPVEAPSEQADQALELAEIMLAMGLGHGAAQTLTEQIRNEPKQALRHWLRLLDIYRKNGQQDEFERSAEELRQHFNVMPEDWHAQPDTLHSLEDYPHIAARLTELWGRPACLVYLHNLLADNRGGSRAGFPQSVAEELLLLVAMLRDDGVTAA